MRDGGVMIEEVSCVRWRCNLQAAATAAQSRDSMATNQETYNQLTLHATHI